MKISKILNSKDCGFSFEFFPPKTDKGMENLKGVAKELAALNPLYVSVTYGAGGSSQERTKEAVAMIKKETGVPIMPHLTCVGASKESLKELLDDYKAKGYKNILALRGDLPEDMDPALASKDFKYAEDLVRFVRDSYDFTMGVALYPEGHPESENLDEDVRYAKKKIDEGAEFAITQMFFVNKYLYDYVELLRKEGVDIPVIPGIIPITDLKQVQRFAELCHATIPHELVDKIKSVEDDIDAMRKVGIDFAIKQCQDLIDNGYRYLHFFALNKARDVSEIIAALKF